MKTTIKNATTDGVMVDAEYTLEMRDDGGSEETIDLAANDPAAIKEECEEWVSRGEWGTDGATIDVRWYLYADGQEIATGHHEVEIEPDHEALIRAAGGDTDCDHDWTSEGEGGCRENPGCWSNGGTAMTFRAHCRKCGLERTDHHTGSQRNPGEHDTVTYRQLDDEEIAAHRENGDMEDVEA